MSSAPRGTQKGGGENVPRQRSTPGDRQPHGTSSEREIATSFPPSRTRGVPAAPEGGTDHVPLEERQALREETPCIGTKPSLHPPKGKETVLPKMRPDAQQSSAAMLGVGGARRWDGPRSGQLGLPRQTAMGRGAHWTLWVSVQSTFSSAVPLKQPSVLLPRPLASLHVLT